MNNNEKDNKVIRVLFENLVLKKSQKDVLIDNNITIEELKEYIKIYNTNVKIQDLVKKHYRENINEFIENKNKKK